MSTINYTVTVADAKFLIDGAVAPKLTFRDGDTYVFDQADSSNSGQILQFSITSNNSGGAEYTTGVTKTGTPGSAGAKTTIITSGSTTDTLYFYSSGGGTYGEEFSNSGFNTSTNYSFLKPIVGGSATAEKWGSMVNHAIDQIDQNITAHTPEGTAVKSTGEGGGSKFLREDGDGTSSWQTVPTPAQYNDDVIQTNIAMLGFKVAVNGSLAKYDLQDQIIDEYETEAGVNTGDSTNQTYTSGEYYSGAVPPATGGTIDSSVSGYKIHTFLLAQTGTNFTPAANMNVEYLVVAGGGGGGRSRGGGGGAGGTETATGFAVTASTAYNIVVGAGGSSGIFVAPSGGGRGGIGGTSSFSSISTTGGGGGAGDATGHGTGGDGGSGGGSTNPDYDAGTGVSGEGYAGGVGGTPAGYGGGGGGGKGALGSAGSSTAGGTGGLGLNSSITGSTVGYAGGGAGGAYLAGTGGVVNGTIAGGGGAGGDGHGVSGGPAAGGAGTANTGGGGGGGGALIIDSSIPGGAGGSGIVVIKYADAVDDLTLQSSDTTAEAAPTKADMVMLIEDAGSGVGTVNTHIKGWVSRYETGGTKTWTEGVLVDEGNWGANKRILAFHDLTLTGTSGTQMAYKITTHSASAVYNTKIHATSIGWR
jgi:hypothetical protein